MHLAGHQPQTVKRHLRASMINVQLAQCNASFTFARIRLAVGLSSSYLSMATTAGAHVWMIYALTWATVNKSALLFVAWKEGSRMHSPDWQLIHAYSCFGFVSEPLSAYTFCRTVQLVYRTAEVCDKLSYRCLFCHCESIVFVPSWIDRDSIKKNASWHHAKQCTTHRATCHMSRLAIGT